MLKYLIKYGHLPGSTNGSIRKALFVFLVGAETNYVPRTGFSSDAALEVSNTYATEVAREDVFLTTLGLHRFDEKLRASKVTLLDAEVSED